MTSELPISINQWPTENGIFKFVMADLTAQDGTAPYMGIQSESGIHIDILFRLLDLYSIQPSRGEFWGKGRITTLPAGKDYNAFAMGRLEVRLESDAHRADMFDQSAFYGLPPRPRQVKRVLDFQQSNGVLMPNYSIFVFDTEVYVPTQSQKR